MTEQIHSCSYFCDRPACIKAQRDELRDKKAKDAETWLRERYGAYRGHFAWRELEEAFNAGVQRRAAL